MDNWPRTIADAKAVQQRLGPRVETADRLGEIAFVAGLDCHYRKGGAHVFAAAVLMTWPGCELVESALFAAPMVLPYIPGYLSFREGPAVLGALSCLSRTPDLLFVDGHGIAHPRRFGLAAHIGVLTGIPALGVAKSRLVGEFQPPAMEKGASAALTDGGATIGCVLRTRERVKPVFVSPGHRVSVDSACRLALQAAHQYRLPEPTRLADKLSRAHRG